MSFEKLLQELAHGNTSSLGDVHAVLSGLKSLVTSSTAADIETARRSMGGHGYSAYAGLGRLYADYLPAATYVTTLRRAQSNLISLCLQL